MRNQSRIFGLILLSVMAAGPTDAAEVNLVELYSVPPEQWPPAEIHESVQAREIAPLPAPLSTDATKAKLGADLFFDPRLSGSRQISCASCHDPELAWTDGRSLPFGNHRKMLRRNTPTLLNAGHQEKYFWDGRADSLEELVLSVIQNEDEMHGDLEVVTNDLSEEGHYKQAFEEVFGTGQVTKEQIAEAVAEFVRTIQSRGRSRFDQFAGGSYDKMNAQEILGLHLFRTKANCMNCHHGPFFTDNNFHDLGLSYFGRELEDLGRFRATGLEDDSGKFKTPTLRNITRTAPYMHVGLFPLRGVMNLYNAGMPDIKPPDELPEDRPFPKKSELLAPLDLDEEEIQAIMAFLATLEEPPQRLRRQGFPPLNPTVDQSP